ncbi:dihydropteroate synthase [Simkania negevensis]|uniref:dihydropteroate synthase n=1 Tax=Simkania negevensis TaxID=83561 RepID=A0ABS3AUY6_9BACT|nr:dihydropteroate synthase [Simkania negevensis]
MAVVNITPDSYYAKSCFYGVEEAVERIKEVVAQGADWIDIGGESTRPGSALVSVDEELARVLPVLDAISSVVEIPISIDTRKPAVAKAAVERGAQMINDITGFQDEQMRNLAADTDVSVCVMHMQGSPATMQMNPSYEEGVVEEVLAFFQRQVEQLVSAGVKEERIVLDPGIGFGKRVEHNIELLQNLERLRALGFPLLIGASRKTFLQKILGKTADDALAGTLATAAYLLDKADILRVHDVQEHKDLFTVLHRLK